MLNVFNGCKNAQVVATPPPALSLDYYINDPELPPLTFTNIDTDTVGCSINVVN